MCIRDRVYRMKGDEYAGLMLDVSGDIAENARQLYKQIRTYIDKTISDRGYAVFFNISAGACTFDSQSEDVYKRQVSWWICCKCKLRKEYACC